MNEFETFWQSYPRKIAKLAAMKAYQKARMVATAEDILKGVEVYKQHLSPDPQFICHATSFLNQGRWMDEYEAPKAKQPSDANWWDECARVHSGTCEGDRMRHHVRMRIEQAS